MSRILGYFVFSKAWAAQHRFTIVYGLFMFVLGILTAHMVTIHKPRETSRIVLTSESKPIVASKSAAVSKQPEKQAAIPEQPKRRPGDEVVVEVHVEQGDTFGEILTRAGIDRREAIEITDALRKSFDVRRMVVGQAFTIHFREVDGKGMLEFVQLVIEGSEERIVLARDGERLKTQKLAKKLEKQVNRAGGVITSSLYSLATELDIPASVLMEAINAYSYDVDFQRDIQVGNRFEVMYETYHDDEGHKIRDGELTYAVLTTGGEDLKIYRFSGKDGSDDFYNEKGMSVRKALLRTPVNGARISSGFGMRRHPVLGYSRMHKGVDFAAPIGTPIYAAGDGTIDFMGKKGGYGNYVKLRHSSGYATAYGHISRFASGMKPGRRVKQGQVIAYVGNTGVSTGPHLHYEVHINGKQANPAKVRTTPGRSLGKTELAEFKSTMRQTDRMIASLPLRAQVANKE